MYKDMYKKTENVSFWRRPGWKTTVLTYFIALLFVFPVFWVFLISFKNAVDAFAVPPKLIFRPVLENFLNVFRNNFLSIITRTVFFWPVFPLYSRCFWGSRAPMPLPGLISKAGNYFPSGF